MSRLLKRMSHTCRNTTVKKLGQISACRGRRPRTPRKRGHVLGSEGLWSRPKDRARIRNSVNWPCTIVAALERTSKALSTADISSLLRRLPLLKCLAPVFLSSFSLPPPSSPSRSSSLSLHPRAEIRAHPRNDPRVLDRFLRVLATRITSSLARSRFPSSSCEESLCRDRNPTLTVWTFLAAEDGANKVKRGLKNVTLSVECGPLTVGAPPFPLTGPPSPRFSHPLLSLLSRGLFLRHVSSDGAETFARDISIDHPILSMNIKSKGWSHRRRIPWFLIKRSLKNRLFFGGRMSKN